MKICIIAGDPSGDIHGASLAQNITQLNPDAEIFSAGGKELAKESTQLVNLVEVAVTGISEVLTYLPKILKIFNHLIVQIHTIKPDIVVLIDFPDFNLRLAKALKNKGYKIFYYISPQVWAWRKKRINLIKRYVDKMMVIFPFEEEFYTSHGVASLYVGHPLTETLTPDISIHNTKSNSPKTIALLPGSRKKEVTAHLPVMLKAASLLKEHGYKCTVIKHPQLPLELFKGLEQQNIPLLIPDSYKHLSGTDLAISSSGTATLELALLGIPTVVIYRMGFLSWLILRQIVHIEHISMANIIARERLFPEFIQYQATPENITEAALGLLENKSLYIKTQEKLKTIRESLGKKQASHTAAQEIIKALSP